MAFQCAHGGVGGDGCQQTGLGMTGGRLESTRATRRRIVAAATTLLLSEGYHAMSVSALAKSSRGEPADGVQRHRRQGGRAQARPRRPARGGRGAYPDGRPARVPGDVGLARPAGVHRCLRPPLRAHLRACRSTPGDHSRDMAPVRTRGWRRSWTRPTRSAERIKPSRSQPSRRCTAFRTASLGTSTWMRSGASRLLRSTTVLSADAAGPMRRTSAGWSTSSLPHSSAPPGVSCRRRTMP